MTYTVLGGRGLIGSRVARALAARGHDVVVPARDDALAGKHLGNVVYAIGVTADFRKRPFDTVDAHVGVLQQVLRDSDFDSLLYLSSTRVYGSPRSDLAVGDESAHLQVDPQNGSDLYNLTKLTGECLALTSGRPCKVARISNVFGDDHGSPNFLPEVLREAVGKQRVTFRTAPASSKDYIALPQVVELLVRIAESGQERLYNVASGIETTHADIASALERLRGIRCTFESGAPVVRFAPIATRRIRDEFQFQPLALLDELESLYESYETNAP